MKFKENIKKWYSCTTALERKRMQLFEWAEKMSLKN